MTDKRTFVIGGADADRKRASASMKAFYSTLDMSRKYSLTIEPYTKRRSLSQNALMWTWIGEVAEHVCKHTGMDADKVHEFFKGKFLHPEIITIHGEEVESRSTKGLTTAQMKDYMDRIHAWVSTELNITLPLPDDLGRGR